MMIDHGTWVDWNGAPKAAPAERKVWTLTFDERDGRLSVPAAAWLQTRCAEKVSLDTAWALDNEHVPTKVRMQRQIEDGQLSLLPSIEDGITVRPRKGSTLPQRFYAQRLLRSGLVKPKQVVKLRVVGDRLVMVGVRAPI